MASVTLILEDTTDADGNTGLLIDWQSDNDYEEGSLAHAYASEFINFIVAQGKKAEIIDRDAPIGGVKPPEDSPLN